MKNNKEKNPELQRWHIEKRPSGRMLAHGIVTNHPRLRDNTQIHTSEIRSVEIKKNEDQAIITTKNTAYICRLSSCHFEKQDHFPDIIDDYDSIRERYYIPQPEPDIEYGKVLLVLSNYDDFYFHSLCVKNEAGEKEEYLHNPHLGMCQDSYLAYTKDHRIDVRYFPYDRAIEFYTIETDGMPLYIENIGSCEIDIYREHKPYPIKPGERIDYSDLKEDIENNTEEDIFIIE